MTTRTGLLLCSVHHLRGSTPPGCARAHVRRERQQADRRHTLRWGSARCAGDEVRVVGGDGEKEVQADVGEDEHAREELGCAIAGQSGTRTIDSEPKRLLGHERTGPAMAALMAERDPRDGASSHCVSVDDSIYEIYERYVALLAREAAKFNLSVVGFGEDPPAGATRSLHLPDTYGPRGEVSLMIPPLRGDLAVRASPLRLCGIFAPYLSTGGPDTRSFVNLTSAISGFRFQGVRDSERANIHTVDERGHVDGHLNAIAWVRAFIQNADVFREWATHVSFVCGRQ
ncbi:hypothetical protein FB451DRAFT_1566602 [Mycena latifolia]|nr:hypothetical protein FB451DRAFT_1566602 [Mycena latifolia]